MTGKTPARTFQDVDEMVLNYSEMQAIASGDPRVKEKIELDNDVARLRLLENERVRHKFSLQDIVAKCEQEIRRISQIALPNAQHDKAYAEKNALPEDKFKKELGGKIYTERAKAGEAIRKEILRVMSSKEAKTVGEYCGFTVSRSSDCCYTPKIKLYAGGMTNYADSNLDSDIGNITRIENVLRIGIDKRIESPQYVEEAKKNLAEAERTKDAPFEYVDELQEKTARLEELNKELHIEKVDEILIDDEENRGANLAEYFKTHGYDCEQRRDELHIKGYGGFYINVNTNQWTRFSANKDGTNSVNCLTEMLGMDFKTAVKDLAGNAVSYAPRGENNSFSAEKKELVMPEKPTI